MTITEPVRLFFALWPSAALQEQFHCAGQQLHHACGGRRTRRENIHLTLAFLGNVAADRLSSVLAVADRIAVPAVSLTFNRLGWWPQNQVAWAATREIPRELVELVKQLKLGLSAQGFKFDERHFKPHVTLLRRARCPRGILESTPIVWSVEDFVLVRSTLQPDGPHYAIVQRWPLQTTGF